jgi:hypothetical protein
MAVHIHWAFAALAAAAVSRIEGVQRAMTLYEHGLGRIAESANSSSESALLVVRLQRCRNTQHPAVSTRPVREAGSSGYVDHSGLPFLRSINVQGRQVVCRSDM